MEVLRGESYLLRARLPWGELVTARVSGVARHADGSITWSTAEEVCGLEPRLDCTLREEDSWIMGWLGSTCDAVAVLSLNEDAPLP